MMKTTVIYFFIFFLSLQVFAAEPSIESNSRYFTKEKIYNTNHFALNDYLEFSVFDMSKLVVTLSGRQIDLKTLLPAPATNTKTQKQIEPPTLPLNPLAEGLAQALPEVPKSFYKSLKNNLIKNRVPVALYATTAPNYAMPIKLYVKLISIDSPVATTNKKGVVEQEVTFKIYGQLKDKKTDAILMRFYDHVAIDFMQAGKNNWHTTIDAAAVKLMDDLAQFMKSKY